MSVYVTLQKRRHVYKYLDMTPDKELINTILQKTWEVTPSKNNFMAYTAHVMSEQKYKDALYKICVQNEISQNEKNTLVEHLELNPNYENILSAPYIIVFTMRYEDQPSVFQQRMWDKGVYYEAMDEPHIDDMIGTSSLEVGMFANTLSALCVENGLDSSYTICIKKDLKYWDSFPFVTRTPIMAMTIGYAKQYRYDVGLEEGWIHQDHRPNYDRIVNFV